ncbi:MAG: sugar transferase [Roseiflexaceae bacterium]
MYRAYGKRIFDLAISVPLLILLAPVMLAIAVLVRIKLGGPVIFRQTRPGLHGQPFEMIKFRTMTDGRDAQGNLLPDEQRMHPFGEWLRSTSLDELPELWLVVTGKLSLVGPRPLLMRYLPRYTARQMRRHEVLPGITGWAQINGRNAISWEQKFEYDVWYVEHVSLWNDIKILWMTFFKITAREGISAEGHATAPEFWGTQAPQTPQAPVATPRTPTPAYGQPVVSNMSVSVQYEHASSQ